MKVIADLQLHSRYSRAVSKDMVVPEIARWAAPYVMMVPLLEILSEVLASGVSSKKVVSEYEKLTTVLGPELKILFQTKPEEVERIFGAKLGKQL